jgi:mRNA interferase RelE/StbE
MIYRLKITREVQRQVDRLPGNMRQRVKRTIAALAFDPRPSSAEELGEELAGFWRIKLDDYRIIYSVYDDVVIVEIVRVIRRTAKTYAGLV